MTETRMIPVIEHDERCAWCDNKLTANGLPPIRTHGKAFHTCCIGAYAVSVWKGPTRR